MQAGPSATTTFIPPSLRIVALGAVFVLCFGAGTALWDHISLPFHNPWNIHGMLTRIGYNPANDIVRFVLLESLPLLALFLLFCLGLLNIRQARGLFPAPGDPFRPGRERVPFFPVLAVLLVLFSLFYAAELPTFISKQAYLDTFHEGETLGPAIDYLAGKTPYRDMLFVHGIIQDPVRSIWAFSLFGRSIWGLRVLESLTHATAIALHTVFLLLVFRRKPMLALIATAIIAGLQVTFMGIDWLGFPSRDILTCAYFCTLPFMANALFTDKDTPPSPWFPFWSFLNAFLPLFAFSYSIDRGFFLTAAWLAMTVASYLAVFHRSPLRRAFLLSQLAAVAAAAAIFTLLVRGALEEFATFSFLIMPRYKELMDGLALNIRETRILIVLAVLALSLFLIAYRLFQEILSRRKLGTAIRAFLQAYYVETAVALVAVFFFRSALGRSDFAHISKHALAIWTLFLLLILRWHLPRRINDWLAGTRATAAAIAIALVLAMLALPDGSGDALYRRFPIHRPDAAFLPQEYHHAISYLQEHMSEEDTFVTLTNEGAWYYLLDQPCPMRFQVVWFAMPPFYQDEIVRDLRENTSIRYLIYSSPAWPNRIDGIGIEERLPRVVDAVDELFDQGVTVSGHLIRRRRD